MTYANEKPVQRDRGGLGLLRLLIGCAELLLAAVVLILATAFVLGILGANPDANFSEWIYARTASLMTPFNGLFKPLEVADGVTIRLSLLFAIAVYTVAGAVLNAVARRFR